MIDVIINEAGAVTVAHDEKPLDGFTELHVGVGGRASLTGPEGVREIGTLMPSMLSALHPGLPGRIVRLAGMAIARVSPLTVHIAAHH